MTTIDPTTLKPGDRIRYSREAVVRSVSSAAIYLEAKTKSGGTGTLTIENNWIPATFELLERPLPEEPPLGTVVVFRPLTGCLTNGTAYQRFGSWWQTTRAGGPGRYSWADVLTFHPDDKFERITIGAPGA